MMLLKKILIIEDEKPNADRLKRLIAIVRPNAMVIDVIDTVSGAVEWLSDNDCPDLIMMDVRLADGLSFDIFNLTEVKCPVIFTTAYDEYAVKAFKVNSIDYLLKPVEKDELENAFRMFEAMQVETSTKSLEGLIEFFNKKEYRSRFLLPFRDGFNTLLVNDVDYFYSELKITHARLADGKGEIIPQTMEELEQQLDPKIFFRANRQIIVKIDAVAQIQNYFNGKLKVILRDSPHREIIVSRDKAAIIKNWMDY